MKAATRPFEYNPHSFGISIHAAREGGDDGSTWKILAWAISIHAAREGGDVGIYDRDKMYFDFNPRRP